MIWPFRKKTKSNIPEFQGVRFTDFDGQVYEYRPVKDITTYELALLWPLAFTNLMITDVFAYIRKHNLERLFVAVAK